MNAAGLTSESAITGADARAALSFSNWLI